MHKRILAIVFMLASIHSFAQQHTPVLEGMEGTALLSELKNQYKPAFVLPYDEARDVLIGHVDNYDGYATCIYTAHQILIPQGADPSAVASMDNSPNGINTEHSYPQSKFSGGNSPKSDMHHLFAARSAANSARSNKPFADILDSQVDTWFYLDMEQSNPPAANVIDNYSEDAFAFFEPREAAKGNIARAIFYFYTMYKNEADAADANFFNSQVATLCDWHAADPADQAEMNRTWRVAASQSNLPNPFVLDCSLAMRAGYCEGISDYCLTVPVRELTAASTFSLSPNPARGQVTVAWAQAAEANHPVIVRIIDATGRQLMEKTIHGSNSLVLSLRDLPTGVFGVQLQSQGQVGVQKLVHFQGE